ncbi:MAG: VOC family protein, partial [Chloroflexi bacterium]|nr:VOC family protein [Chloroflexota bacterium]
MATINHIGLTVSNLEASIDFYRDGVGMTEALRNDSVGGEWFDTLTNNRGARIKIAHLTLEGLTVQ